MWAFPHKWLGRGIHAAKWLNPAAIRHIKIFTVEKTINKQQIAIQCTRHNEHQQSSIYRVESPNNKIVEALRWFHFPRNIVIEVRLHRKS